MSVKEKCGTCGDFFEPRRPAGASIVLQGLAITNPAPAEYLQIDFKVRQAKKCDDCIAREGAARRAAR